MNGLKFILVVLAITCCYFAGRASVKNPLLEVMGNFSFTNSKVVLVVEAEVSVPTSGRDYDIKLKHEYFTIKHGKDVDYDGPVLLVDSRGRLITHFTTMDEYREKGKARRVK